MNTPELKLNAKRFEELIIALKKKKTQSQIAEIIDLADSALSNLLKHVIPVINDSKKFSFDTFSGFDDASSVGKKTLYRLAEFNAKMEQALLELQPETKGVEEENWVYHYIYHYHYLLNNNKYYINKKYLRISDQKTVEVFYVSGSLTKNDPIKYAEKWVGKINEVGDVFYIDFKKQGANTELPALFCLYAGAVPLGVHPILLGVYCSFKSDCTPTAGRLVLEKVDSEVEAKKEINSQVKKWFHKYLDGTNITTERLVISNKENLRENLDALRTRKPTIFQTKQFLIILLSLFVVYIIIDIVLVAVYEKGLINLIFN